MQHRSFRDGGLLRLPSAGADPTDLHDFRVAFGHGRRRQTGEEKLMYAILWDALHVLQTHGRRVHSTYRVNTYRETIAWLESDDETWPCAFVSVCHVLGIDPAGLRAQVRRLLAVEIPERKVIPFAPSGRRPGTYCRSSRVADREF